MSLFCADYTRTEGRCREVNIGQIRLYSILKERSSLEGCSKFKAVLHYSLDVVSNLKIMIIWPWQHPRPLSNTNNEIV